MLKIIFLEDNITERGDWPFITLDKKKIYNHLRLYDR